MIRKTKSTCSGCVHISFELPCCVWADRIYLIGEFNNWDPRTLPMYQARDGVWRIELDLPRGRTYEFRYLADGHWLTDNHADGLTANPYGAQNSIVDTTLPIALLQIGGGAMPPDPVWWQKGSHVAHLHCANTVAQNKRRI